MKQVVVVRTDIEMSRGKTAAQVAHASQHAMEDEDTDDKVMRLWRRKNCPKVVLAADGEEELRALYDEAKQAGLPTFLVSDAGHTELDPSTTTALGIGPARSGDIDAITGHLSTL